MKRAPRSTPARSDALTPPGEAVPPLLGKLRPLLIAAGVFIVAVLIVFGGVLFDGGDRVISSPHGDTYNVFVGWYEFTFGEMAHGNLPLWNPHLFGGAPCLGGFQEALLYPPSWLHLFMPLPQALNWGIALHVFLAGLFTYFWTLRRGMHPAAAIVSGLIFMFGGSYFMHITPGHIPNLQTMAWTPLIFLAIDDLTMTQSFRGAWLGAAAVAMAILAGHPQYVYYIALIAGPYALLGVWRSTSRTHALFGLALMGAGGAALSAAQLFTGLQASTESLRSHLPFETASTFFFPPENLLTAALPTFFGNASRGVYWGRWYLWEDSIFVGAAGLALAIYGAIRGDKKYRKITILVFLLITLLIALGRSTPIYRLLFDVLPGFSSFRGVSKIIFLAALFLAYLAGVGFDQLLRAPRLSRKGPTVIAIAAVIALVTGGALWSSGNAGADGVWGRTLLHIVKSNMALTPETIIKPDPVFFRASAHGAAISLFWCGATCVGLAGIWLAARFRRPLAYGVPLLLAVELLIFACQNVPSFHRAEITRHEADMRQLLDKIEPDSRVITKDPSVVLGAGGFEAWGNDPMVLRRYAQFLARDADPLPVVLPPMAANWAMMRIRLVQSPTDGQWHVLRLPLLKRAELIENVRVIDDEKEMYATLSDRKFDFHHTVLLEKPVTPMPVVPPGSDAPGVVEIKDLPGESDEVEVTADIKRACILLISDNYSAGWHTVPLPDAPGRSYEIVPADHTLRGIALAPGSHHFILEYRPMAYVVGKWVSIGSILVWLSAGIALTAWGKRRMKLARPKSQNT